MDSRKRVGEGVVAASAKTSEGLFERMKHHKGMMARAVMEAMRMAANKGHFQFTL